MTTPSISSNFDARHCITLIEALFMPVADLKKMRTKIRQGHESSFMDICLRCIVRRLTPGECLIRHREFSNLVNKPLSHCVETFQRIGREQYWGWIGNPESSPEADALNRNRRTVTEYLITPHWEIVLFAYYWAVTSAEHPTNVARYFQDLPKEIPYALEKDQPIYEVLIQAWDEFCKAGAAV